MFLEGGHSKVLHLAWQHLKPKCNKPMVMVGQHCLLRRYVNEASEELMDY